MGRPNCDTLISYLLSPTSYLLIRGPAWNTQPGPAYRSSRSLRRRLHNWSHQQWRPCGMGQSVIIKTEAPTRLVAGAAHDLRNLLFVISAHSHRLQAMADQGHPWVEDLRTIQEASDRCSELAAQILSEARILDQPARPLDINAVIHGVAPLLTQLIGDHVVLQSVLTPNLWPVTANSIQIEQIVMNLVVNAR